MLSESKWESKNILNPKDNYFGLFLSYNKMIAINTTRNTKVTLIP